jgi:hypothetical protein
MNSRITLSVDQILFNPLMSSAKHTDHGSAFTAMAGQPLIPDLSIALRGLRMVTINQAGSGEGM